MSSILSSAVDSAVLSLHFRASEQLRRVEEALRLPKGNNAKKLRSVLSENLVGSSAVRDKSIKTWTK